LTPNAIPTIPDWNHEPHRPGRNHTVPAAQPRFFERELPELGEVFLAAFVQPSLTGQAVLWLRSEDLERFPPSHVTQGATLILRVDAEMRGFVFFLV